MTVAEPNFLQNLGNFTSAAAAGLQGQGPQFIETMRARRAKEEETARQLEMDRRKTIFQDAATALQYGKAGRFDLVEQLGQNRLQASSKFPGVDFSDTARLTNLAQKVQSGDTEAEESLMQELEATVAAGRDIGMIDRPPANAAIDNPTGIKRSDILAGGHLVAKVLNNGEVEYEIPDKEELEKINKAEARNIKAKEELAATVTGARERTKDEEERRQERVTSGIRFAKTLPTLRRALELMDSVETGNINYAKLKAKQWFGIAEADEAELIYSLAQNVLKQLRPTFGAQFTAAEGNWLEAIEAGISKSTEANRRLFRKSLFEAQTQATTASKEALDTYTQSELMGYLTGEHNITDQALEKIYETRLQKQTREDREAKGAPPPPTGGGQQVYEVDF